MGHWAFGMEMRQYGWVKVERGKVSNTYFTLYPLTFSQTTREVHTAYPNRTRRGGRQGSNLSPLSTLSSLSPYPLPMPHALYLNIPYPKKLRLMQPQRKS